MWSTEYATKWESMWWTVIESGRIWAEAASLQVLCQGASPTWWNGPTPPTVLSRKMISIFLFLQRLNSRMKIDPFFSVFNTTSNIVQVRWISMHNWIKHLDSWQYFKLCQSKALSCLLLLMTRILTLVYIWYPVFIFTGMMWLEPPEMLMLCFPDQLNFQTV